MSLGIDHGRRHFLRRAAMTIGAARAGMFGRVLAWDATASLAGATAKANMDANQSAPRELAAIGRATEWLNTPRLTADSLLRKVVIIDFCTYTCINWLRTLPYVRAWSQKYTQGAVVIGVHTPEFAFEHDLNNVRRAIRQMRIEYPIVID